MNIAHTIMKILKKRLWIFALALIIISALPGVTPAEEYWIEAQTLDKTMPDGAIVKMWGYAQCGAAFTACGAATVPGPPLTVTPGLTLTINLRNSLTGLYTEPTSVVIPGQPAIMVPTWTDNSTGARAGTAQRVRSFTAEAAAGGGTAVYTWDNFRAGTYLYESGTHQAVQIQMGLYGVITANPAVGQAYTPSVTNPNTTFQSELPLVFSEIDTDLHTAIETNAYGPPAGPGRITSTIHYQPEYFLINGDPYFAGRPPLALGNTGGTALIRFLNAGLKTHVPVVNGQYMTLIAEDGNLLPYPKEQYTVMLPAGKTTDALITLPATTGQMAVYDRMLNITNRTTYPGGMIANLDVVVAATQLLTVNTTGSTGTGTITSDDALVGINCGLDCSEIYNTGTIVTLTAAAAAGSYFAGWSGAPACTGTAPCALTMNAPYTVTGLFNLALPYTVTPLTDPNGTIVPPIPQTVVAPNTTAFTLTPNAGFQLQSVTGCGGTLAGNTYTTGPVTADCTVTASFAPITHVVTPSAGAGGSLNPPAPQTVNENSTTAFTVTPDAGFQLQSVTGCGGTLAGNTYTTGPITADCTVTAMFTSGLTVTVPNGGENWTSGTPQTIRWTYTGNPGALVRIELLKGGALNRTISTASFVGTGGNGSLNWTIPSNQTPGADYRVRVTSITNATFTDTGDADFTILGPTITVAVPDGGENWAAGSVQTIRWTYTGNPGTIVRIELLKGGVLNRTITASAFRGNGGNGSFNWTIPSNQTPGADYKVRITSTTNATFTDMSNADFSIIGPTIAVTAPNGSETWSRSTMRTITWTYTGNPGTFVRIDLLKGAAVVRTIAGTAFRGNGGAGSFSYFVPTNLIPGADYRVSITSTTNAAITDMSDNFFTVQ